jgi:Zn-dependent alcohol dehydrogenase
MRAAVLREIGAPLRVEDVELDEPGPGEVAVRIEAAGVGSSNPRIDRPLSHTAATPTSKVPPGAAVAF